MDSYNYDSTALASLISSLEAKLDEYNTTIESIKTLKNTIESSNEWVQDTIKSPFISKCEEYLTYFNNATAKLEAHIAYLKKKNSVMEILEEAYS